MGNNDTHGSASQITTGSIGRRAYLAGAGAAVVAGLAGCTGGTGGGSDGGQTGSGSGKTVTIASFPLDVDGVVFDYLDKNGVFADKLSDTGYDYDLKLIFDDIPQYVAGKADIAGFTELEAAQIGVQQEIPTVVFARRANAYLGWLVKSGSKWDPDKTGSVADTVQMIADENATIAIGGWDLGHIPCDEILYDQAYGLKFAEEGGDFDIRTADLPAIPKLIDQGNVAMGANSPSHGAAGRLLDDTLKPLFWDHDKINDLGLGLPPLAGLTTRKSFMNEHEDVVRAVFDAANEGYTWFFENGLDEIPQNEEWRQKLGATNEEETKYIIKWQMHEDVKYETKAIPRPEDITFTRDRINDAETFLGHVEDVGFISSGWQDYVEMVTL